MANDQILRLDQGEAASFDFPEILDDADIRALLDQKKTALRKLDRQVTALLSEKHEMAEASVLKASLIELDCDLTDISDLLEDRECTQKRTDVQNELRVECDRLLARHEKINRKLAEDVASLRYQETKDAKDPIKVILYIGALPALAANVLKIFFDEKSPVLPYVEAGSLFLGTVVAFPKEAKRIWKASANAICGSVRCVKSSIRNDFTLYYVKTESLRTARTASAAFNNGAHTVTSRVTRALLGTRKTAQRILQFRKHL